MKQQTCFKDRSLGRKTINESMNPNLICIKCLLRVKLYSVKLMFIHCCAVDYFDMHPQSVSHCVVVNFHNFSRSTSLHEIYQFKHILTIPRSGSKELYEGFSQAHILQNNQNIVPLDRKREHTHTRRKRTSNNCASGKTLSQLLN